MPQRRWISRRATLYVDQTKLRLLSMDAFEQSQTCSRDNQEYLCGAEATRALNRYKRPLVHCWIGDIDLGREMVREGWALAEYGSEYRTDQESAQAVRSGAWAGTFTCPLEWRKLN